MSTYVKITKRAEIGIGIGSAFRSQYLWVQLRATCMSKDDFLFTKNPWKFAMWTLGLLDVWKSYVVPVGFVSSHGKIQGFRSWQFKGFSTDAAPFNHAEITDVKAMFSQRSCDDAVPTTYISILVFTFCEFKMLWFNLFLIDVVKFDLNDSSWYFFHEVFVEPATTSAVLTMATWLQGV